MTNNEQEEGGWQFRYDPWTKFVGRYHSNGRGKQSVCEAVTDEWGEKIVGALTEMEKQK